MVNIWKKQIKNNILYNTFLMLGEGVTIDTLPLLKELYDYLVYVQKETYGTILIVV